MTILYVSGLAKEGEKRWEVLTDAKINYQFSLVKVDEEKNVIEYIIGQYKITKVEEGEAYVNAVPLTGTPCQRGILPPNQDVKSELRQKIIKFLKSKMLS